MSKASQKREEKRHGIGGNNPPPVLVTAKQCGDAINFEATLSGKKDAATATRYRLFLMLTCSDGAFANDMRAAWHNTIAPAGQTKEVRERVRSAKDTLFSMFNVPKLLTKEEEETKTKEELDRYRVMHRNTLETVHLCVNVTEQGHSDAFTFENDGVTIKYESALGQHIWESLKWNGNGKAEADANNGKHIKLVPTTWYAVKGRSLAWSAFQTLMVPSDRDPDKKKGKPIRFTGSSADPSNAMQQVANIYESHAPTVNDMSALRSSVENALRVVKLSLVPIVNASELIADVKALEERIFAVIGRSKPEVKVEGGSGNVVNAAEFAAKTGK